MTAKIPNTPHQGHVRPATAADIVRIAEIQVFAKRTTFSRIFGDLNYSFNVLRVPAVMAEFEEYPERLSGMVVYDDGILKGMVRVAPDSSICELYLDPYFEGTGVGSVLFNYAVQQLGGNTLLVLEKNERAIRFYERHGFRKSGERTEWEHSGVFLVRMDDAAGKRAA